MTRMRMAIVIVSAFGGWVCSYADVSNFQMFAASRVVQYRNGMEEQRMEQSKGFPAPDQTVPIEVTSELYQQDSSGGLSWSGFNRVLANDPQYNSSLPTDFMIELAGGSADSDVSLLMHSQARQSRTITILAEEFPTFSSADTLTLRSAFLLEGALAAVVPDTAGSTSGLEMTLGLNLSKGSASLWSGTLTAMGQEDGSLLTVTDGFVANDFAITPVEVADLGKVWIISFADHPLPFEYQGHVGETFDLTADLTLDFAVPGGLAAGAAFGTVPAELVMTARDLFESSSLAAKVAAAPEPGTVLLMLGGVLGLSRRRSR